MKLELDIQMFADGKVTINTQLDDSGFRSGLDKMKSVASTGFKVVGAAVGVAAAEITALGKASLDAYADYEQLVGGIDTLYGLSKKDIQEMEKVYGKTIKEIEKEYGGITTAADEMKDSASQAWKTAGMSANEYMETVTSFSASLIQSLDSDTYAAAEYANTAIIDMSDNANKLGTDISMIQNAYQGFAKQNYTMLDNLKLGYGGTKTEMERLIDDANEIKKANGEMANLSIESFADIVEAIHTIQDEMGIAGTTAEEAATTISGSVNSMKSAWKNLMVGIANDNADLEGLLNDFVESISTVGDNIIPRIEIILDGIVDIIVKLGEKIIKIMPSVLDRILPTLVNGAISIVKEFTNTILSMLPELLQTGITVFLEFIKGITQTLPQLISQIVNAVILIVETLLDNIDLIIDAGIELIMGLIEGLIEALPILIEKIPIIIEKLVTKLTDPEMLGKLVQAAGKLIAELGIGLIKAIPELLKSIPQIISALVKGLGNAASAIKDVGINLVKGLWNGISGSLQWIKDKITGWVGNVLGFIKKLFGIASPSKVMRDQVGKYLAQGLGVGFDNELDNVYDDMQRAIDLETSKMTANVQTSGTYQMAMAGLPQFNLLDNTNNTTQLVVNGKVLAEVVNTENRNREVAVG